MLFAHVITYTAKAPARILIRDTSKTFFRVQGYAVKFSI